MSLPHSLLHPSPLWGQRGLTGEAAPGEEEKAWNTTVLAGTSQLEMLGPERHVHILERNALLKCGDNRGIRTLAGVTQWIEHRPANQRVACMIPSQGTCLGCGPGPQ